MQLNFFGIRPLHDLPHPRIPSSDRSAAMPGMRLRERLRRPLMQ
jgi:hypothetical protein